MASSQKHQYTAIFVILASVWVWAAIAPLDRSDWLLENLLVFLTFAILASTYNLFRFSLLSYWLFTLFMCLHLYGSHYTYAETPLGFWAQDLLNLNRNHYDRAVHLSFGLLTVYPFLELIARSARAQGAWLYIFGLTTILSMSALYELIEMLAALIISPELGSAFLGTQGDEWDAQKDTVFAFIGALFTVLICIVSKVDFLRRTAPR